MMGRRIPPIYNGERILIICEGYEESEYLNRLKSLRVWDGNFCIEIENAKSIDNIFAKYQYKYANGNYKLIFIFCDTEMHPYEQFISLKNRIDDMHGNKASSKVLFFSNPCTMQIILSHFEKVSLRTNSKSGNGQLIERLAGICDYRATEPQRTKLLKRVNRENYYTMKENLQGISDNYKVLPSTNVLELFDHLETYNKKWIASVNKAIEKETKK